jgi:predicted GIY-YIG superfamily endonuclease
MLTAYLYILRCADGSYYTGTTRASLERRVAEHNAGTFGRFTSTRRPVTLAFSELFERVEDAIAAERQIKGWRRDKKEALIQGRLESLSALSKRGMTSRSR